MDAIRPRTMPRRLHIAQGFPHRAIALKPAPERDLPNPIPLLHPPFRLRVPQLVPNRARRSIPKPMQSHPRGLHVLLRELQILLQFIDHRPPSRVYAEMLKRQLKIRYIRLHFRIQQLPPYKRREEKELLAYWQHQRAHRRDIGFQRLSCDRHQIFRQRNPCFAHTVLLLVYAFESGVVRPTVGADHVDELVLGAAAVGGFVGQEDSSATDAEEAVGYQHGFFVAEVPVLGDVFGAHDDGVGVAVDL